VFDYFKKHPKLAATFATKWVNTKLLDYVPENKIRVRMSLMPEKMRAILENGTSPIIKSSVPGEAFPYSTHINFSPIIYHDKKLSGYKNSSTSLTTKYQRSLKQAGLECFPYSQC
jgi:spore photoproduct lyase